MGVKAYSLLAGVSSARASGAGSAACAGASVGASTAGAASAGASAATSSFLATVFLGKTLIFLAFKSPAETSMLCTVPEGLAPTDIQYLMRSSTKVRSLLVGL